MILLLLLILFATPAAADETSVSTNQESSAVIIDGVRRGTRSGSGQPCREYIVAPRVDGVLPGDSLVAIPCRGSGVRRLSRALREQVIRYLPPLNAGMAPASDALVRVPQVFWSGQPPLTLQVTVLDTDVVVVLTPTFQWSFGDGSSLVTTKSGGRYPNREVTHTYNAPCRCAITVTTTWSGRWSDGGAWRDLASVLTQQRSLSLDVRRAPIRLVE